MTPLVSQLWPQFMADPDFAASFGRVIVEHARMLRQERQVVFTLRSAAPLDKGLCARLLASLQPDYEGFELKIDNLFGYAALDEAVHALFEEGNPVGVKCALSVMGRIGDTMRLPLVAGSGKLRAKFEELIARYDLR